MRHILAPIFAATLTAAIALTAAGCSSSSDSSSTASATHSAVQLPKASTETAAGPTTTDDATAAATTAAAAPTDVSATINDSAMGYKFQALSIVRKFPFNDKQTALADRGDTEQVLVKVKVSVADKFYTSATCDDLSIVPDGSSSDTIPSSSNNSVVEADMKAAGYTPLADVAHGKTGTGWCSFAVQKPTDILDLRYKRLAASTSGGKTIPEKIYIVPMKAKA